MKQWAIQTAIYSQLTGTAAVMALVTGVFDDVPQGTDYPYIVIGEDTGIEWDTDDSRGTSATLTVHVWSRVAGKRETKQIMEAIYDALHRAPLPVSGMTTVTCHWEFGETFLDADGETRHGVTRYRLIIEEA